MTKTYMLLKGIDKDYEFNNIKNPSDDFYCDELDCWLDKRALLALGAREKKEGKLVVKSKKLNHKLLKKLAKELREIDEKKGKIQMPKVDDYGEFYHDDLRTWVKAVTNHINGEK